MKWGVGEPGPPQNVQHGTVICLVSPPHAVSPEHGVPASISCGYSVILRGSDLSQKYKRTLKNFPEVCLQLPRAFGDAQPRSFSLQGSASRSVREGSRDWGTGHQPQLGAPPNLPGWWKSPAVSDPLGEKPAQQVFSAGRAGHRGGSTWAVFSASRLAPAGVGGRAVWGNVSGFHNPELQT